MEFLQNFYIILFTFSTIVSSSNIGFEKPNECPDACILLYAPVCATNGICTKSFSNSCFLGIENCLAEQNNEYPWYEIPDIYCDCPTQCAYNYSPVCAKSMTKTTLFASVCSMLETECLTGENYKLVSPHLCTQNIDPSNCGAIFCSMDYDPICAFNGYEYATFSNQCLLDVSNCFQNYAWGVHSFGECPPCLTDPYYYSVDVDKRVSVY